MVINSLFEINALSTPLGSILFKHITNQLSSRKINIFFINEDNEIKYTYVDLLNKNNYRIFILIIALRDNEMANRLNQQSPQLRLKDSIKREMSRINRDTLPLNCYAEVTKSLKDTVHLSQSTVYAFSLLLKDLEYYLKK